MSVIKNCVLLLKSEKSDSEEDKYENCLKLNNFEVIHVKTLLFHYKHLDIFKKKLLKPDDFNGIIFSSPRCVTAVAQALNKAKVEELWRLKSNFSIGATTYKEALDKLGLPCKGKESGSAKKLSQVIIEEKSNYTKPFLLPHGNLNTDNLQQELLQGGINIEGILVYDTLPNPDIKEQLCKATRGFTKMPEFVVFFSPSGLHSSLPYLQTVPIDMNTVKIIAIGPVTAEAVEGSNLNVYGIAQCPTPEELLKSILG